MMNLLKINDLDLNHQRVLIREDFNVPIHHGKITSDARLKAALPTIQYALKSGAKVILVSHLGRPNEGEFSPEFSLEPVATALSHLLNTPVKFLKDWIEGITWDSCPIIVCENVRFQNGEKKNDAKLAQKMAALCDIFVMDAFATAHRAEASTVGIAQYAPIACAGLLLYSELQALNQALDHPKRPLVAIVGGAKISTKLPVLENLIKKVDHLILGGGIANTFLRAQNIEIGKSLYEKDQISEAQKLLKLADQSQIQILLPKDVTVAQEFSEQAQGHVKNLDQIDSNDMILDIGPQTAAEYTTLIQRAATILWNGPLGVFEFPAFAQGTRSLSLAIAESKAFSIAGGGDTIAAIEQFQIADKVSYISTGGGAFLEFIEGKELPAVKILQERNSLC